jgi:hypothetical protein
MVGSTVISDKLKTKTALAPVFMKGGNKEMPAQKNTLILEGMSRSVPAGISVVPVIVHEAFHPGGAEDFKRSGSSPAFTYIGSFPEALARIETGSKITGDIGGRRNNPGVKSGFRTGVPGNYMERKIRPCFSMEISA